jgi:hypothetical protein
MTKMRDDDLDDLFTLAAKARPAPSPALIDRVLADALAAQPRHPRVAASRQRLGFLQRLAEAFGGLPVLAGVTSTVFLGLALGYLNPAAADYLTGGQAASDALDLFPSADPLTTEG